MDIVAPAIRSKMMSSIRGRDTKPELVVRKYLHASGFRFRLHDKRLPDSPDIILLKYRVCIFVHGCFWHRHECCRYSTMPSTRTKFWKNKFEENFLRDNHASYQLLSLGWLVIVIWECVLKKIKNDTLVWLPRTVISGSCLLVWPQINNNLTAKP